MTFKKIEKIYPKKYVSLEQFRREIFFNNITIKNKIGLEIGAYTRPTIPEENVKYADFYSTEQLQESLLRQEGGGRQIKEEAKKIVKVDYVIKDENYEKYISDKFDFIIANHVMEHVPNPLRWLEKLEGMLNKDGYLFITLPDKKYCFDKFRLDTDFTHFLAEYFQNDINEKNAADLLNAAIFYDHNYVSKKNDIKKFLNKENLKGIINSKDPGYHLHVFQAETFLENVLKPILYTRILNLHIEDYAISHQLGEFITVLQKGFRPVEIDEEKILQAAKDTVDTTSPQKQVENSCSFFMKKIFMKIKRLFRK